MRLSIVIPVFNEEAVIGMTNKKVISIVEELILKHLIDDYELLYSLFRAYW